MASKWVFIGELENAPPPTGVDFSEALQELWIGGLSKNIGLNKNNIFWALIEQKSDSR